jgi:hypothetical protein
MFPVLTTECRVQQIKNGKVEIYEFHIIGEGLAFIELSNMQQLKVLLVCSNAVMFLH